MSGRYLIGVDGGTEGLRAGIFDLSGTPLAFAATPYETDFPSPGRAEQNPNDWWAALGRSVRKAIAEAGVSRRDIAAICMDTTCCSVVALDEAGKPLRPALIWMDVRAAKEADAIVETGDDALRSNNGGSGPVSAEWMIPKALWLKRHEPEIYDRAATICEYQDYLNYHLTGRMVASINNVSIRWHYQKSHGGFQISLLEKLGISDLVEKWPSQILALGEEIGGLTAPAADHLGLPAGLPVAQGGADALIGVIGLGVVRPGAMALITGSSHLQFGLSEKPFYGPGIWGTYDSAIIPGLHVVEGGQASTGSVLNWYKNLLGKSYCELDGEAAKIAPGSDGVVVLDHFQGARTPNTDSLSRGAFTGLSLNHSGAHIYRAIMESVAFGTAHVIETMQMNGFAAGDIVIAGGVTRSDLWLQIHADIAGCALKLTKVPDAPSLGSAILAAVCADYYGSIEEAIGQMVSIEREVVPNMQAHGQYGDAYEAYKRAYVALKSIHHPG